MSNVYQLFFVGNSRFKSPRVMDVILSFCKEKGILFRINNLFKIEEAAVDLITAEGPRYIFVDEAMPLSSVVRRLIPGMQAPYRVIFFDSRNSEQECVSFMRNQLRYWQPFC